MEGIKKLGLILCVLVCVCVCVKERREQNHLTVSQYAHPCFLTSTSCKVCVVMRTLYHTTDSILHGVGACVSRCKLSSWSPLWESLAVKLILLSHTRVSVPHLSAQPQGPSRSPLHTWLYFFLLLSDFKALQAGCSHRN